MRRGTVWACVAGILFCVVLLGCSVSNAEMFVPSRIVENQMHERATTVTEQRLKCQLENVMASKKSGATLKTSLEKKFKIDDVKKVQEKCSGGVGIGKTISQQTNPVPTRVKTWVSDNAHFWKDVKDCSHIRRSSDIRGVEFQLDNYTEPKTVKDRKYVFVGLGDPSKDLKRQHVFGVYLLPCFAHRNKNDCSGAYNINVVDSKYLDPFEDPFEDPSQFQFQFRKFRKEAEKKVWSTRSRFYRFKTNDERGKRNMYTCGSGADDDKLPEGCSQTNYKGCEEAILKKWGKPLKTIFDKENNRRWCGRAFLTDRIAIIVNNDDPENHKFELYVNGILRFEGKTPAEHDYTYSPIFSANKKDDKHQIHHPSFIRNSTVTFKKDNDGQDIIGPSPAFVMMGGASTEGIEGYRYLGPNFERCQVFNKPKDSSPMSFVEKSLTTNAKSKSGNENRKCKPRVIDTGTGKQNALGVTSEGLGPASAFLGAGAGSGNMQNRAMPGLIAFEMDNNGKKTEKIVNNLQLVPDPNSLFGVQVKFECTSGTESLCCPTENRDIFVQVMDRTNTKDRTKMFYAHVSLEEGTTGLSMEWCTANSQQDCEHQFATRRRRLLGRKSSFC